MREEKSTIINRFYSRTIPRIDLKKVYKKTKSGWILLKNARFNTGFVESHLEGFQTFGYTVYNKISTFFIVDIDAHNEEDKNTVINRYELVIQKLGTPSFVVTSSSSGGLHLYYVTEKLYYTSDLQASVRPLLSHIRGIDVLPNGASNIRLPLGKDSHLVNPDNPLETYSHLSKYDQILMLEQYMNVYEKLEDICRHIKTVRQKSCNNTHEEVTEAYKYIKSIAIQSDSPTVGFYAGNRYNSLIQLFNKSHSKEEFIELCNKEMSNMFMYKEPSKDLSKLEGDKLNKHFISFYDGMIKHKQSNPTPVDRDYIKTPLNSYQIVMLRKWLQKLPEYKHIQIDGVSKKASRERFTTFSIKVINEFLKQSTRYPDRKTYALPSVFLKSLDSYYNVFWKVLRGYITKMIRNYFYNTINYRCRVFSLEVFKEFFTRVIKRRLLDITYYKEEDLGHPRRRQNHYYILPDLFRKMKKKSDIMRDMGCHLENYTNWRGQFRRRWKKPFGLEDVSQEDILFAESVGI